MWSTSESALDDTARAEVHTMRAEMLHIVTKADLRETEGTLTARLNTMEARLIKWMIATATVSVMGAATLAFSIAKFVS
jgi:hypothetical protein